MKFAASVSLVLTLASPSLHAQDALGDRIDASLSRYFKPDQPGATIIVSKDGAIVFRKAYGLAQLEPRRAMEAGMVMRIGSLTKQFTAAAILMLVDEGKLSLQDEVGKFLPGYPTRGARITIEHLLTHTSGIVNFTGKPGFLAQSAQEMTVSQLIDSFKDDPLDFQPGTRWNYDNSGYVLLGAVIEAASGQSYADFLAQRIFIPLGMEHTAYDGRERVPAPHAVGYSKDGPGFRPAWPLSPSQRFAASGLVSTVDDLAKWDAAIGNGKLLKPESWRQAFTPYRLANGAPTDYGYGWRIGELKGFIKRSHSGGIFGYTSFAERIPSANLFVAVLANADSGIVSPEVVADRAAAIALGKPFPDHVAIKLPEADLESYRGNYAIGAANVVTVHRVGDKLAIQRDAQAPLELLPYARDGFFIPDTLTDVVFIRDRNDRVTSLVFYFSGVPQLSHTRIER